ncbi:hypothetical protein ACJX0J_021214, partial [Zea mays]
MKHLMLKDCIFLLSNYKMINGLYSSMLPHKALLKVSEYRKYTLVLNLIISHPTMFTWAIVFSKTGKKSL